MSKLRKSTFSIVLVVLLLLSCTFVASATEVVFSNQYVDSNTFGVVTGAYKETTSTTATVQITNIYKADGSSSLYSCVRAKATSSGVWDYAYKGGTTILTIPSASRAKGSWVSLYAMGNNPSLDCIIAGYWIVH